MEAKKYKYECEKCNYFTNAQSAYENHLITGKHKTGKNTTRCDKKFPEKCEICNYEPKTNKSYIEHNLLYHSTIDKRKEYYKYFCEKCNYGTLTESLYNRHLETKKHSQMIKN